LANILFVYDKFNTGGIETLILRMSNWLVSHGHELTILMKKEGEITDMLPHEVNKLVLGKRYGYLYLPFLTRWFLDQYDLFKFDIVMSFHPKSNWIASNIVDIYKLKCHYITGVYHPRAYYNNNLHVSEKVVYRALMKKLSPQRVLFMNHECKRLHQEHLSLSFQESIVWPLPIDTYKVCSSSIVKESHNKPIRIISIGRLAQFKTYNLYMIDIVKSLKMKGYDIVYDIYGTGELKSRMQQKIEMLDASEYIKLRGLLPYAKFQKTIQEAYVFVGMGTAVLEAALCGVPALVAIENSQEAKSYGYLYELPYYNVGEYNEELTEKNVEDLLEKLLNIDRNVYQEISKKSIEYVQAYSLEKLMPKWLQAIEDIPSDSNMVTFCMRCQYITLEFVSPIFKMIKKLRKKR